MRVVVYDNLNSLEKIQEKWNRLVAESSFPNIFLTWEWIKTWWKWFGKESILYVVVAFEDSEVVGLLPLYIKKESILHGFQLDTIRFLGDGGPVYPDYLGPIVTEANVEKVIFPLSQSLFGIPVKWNIIKLSDVLIETSPVKNFVDALSKMFVTEIYEGESCPYQPLPSNYEAFVGGLSPRRRESVRRLMRKVKKKYNIKFKCYTSENYVEEAFSLIKYIYRRSLRGQNINNGFNRSDYFGFHREVAQAFAKQGWLRLYILWFNEVPVAFIYGYFYNGVFWYYQTGYDLAYSNEGPGSVILQLVIASLIDEGASQFDFLRGNEEYKFHFANQERKTKSIYFFRKHGMIHIALAARRSIYNIFGRIKK